MDQLITPLDTWVDHLLHMVFYQPDDNLSDTAYETCISRDATIRINGKPYTYHTYKEIINKARATFHISIRNNDALLLVEDCQGRNAGSVAYKSSVILKDSRTGAEIESESVILATVEWKDEKRILTELTEVTK